MCLAVPGLIIALDREDPSLATVDTGGVRRQVDISCLRLNYPEQELLDRWVMVHVGFALAFIQADQAQQQLQLLQELSDKGA